MIQPSTLSRLIFSGTPLLISAALVTTLSGCGLNEWADRVNSAADQKQCGEFGFRPGTDAFAQCRQQQAAQREQQIQQSIDRSEFNDAMDKLNKK